MRIVGASLFIACAACSESVELRHLEWPELLPETHSVIVVIRSSPTPIGDGDSLRIEAVAVEAFPRTSVRIEYNESPTARIDVLAYPEDLSKLGITPGRLLRPGGDSSRGLPPPERIYTYDEGGESWASVTMLDEELQRVRIPALDPFPCLIGGGCAGADARAACVLPCELPAPPTPPEPPAPPELPRILGCRSSTTSLAQRQLGVCEPAFAPRRCGPAEVQPPDQEACVPIAGPCPARWPTLPASGNVLFVDDDSTGGDGSMAAPFTTIAEALAQATAGDTIAIARGLYREQIWQRFDVTMLGACAEDTVIDAGGSPTLRVEADVLLRGLRFQNGMPAIVVEGPDAKLGLREVVVEGGDSGIQVLEGELDAEVFLARDVGGEPVYASHDSTLRLSRAYFENSVGLAVAVVDTARLTADHLVIRGVTAAPGRRGAGVIAEAPSTRVDITNALIEGAKLAGITAAGSSTAVTLTDVVIRDIQDLPDVLGGHGIYTDEGARLDGKRLLIQRNRSRSVYAAGSSHLEVEDLTVRDQYAVLADELEAVLSTITNSVLVVRRASISRADGRGLWVEGGEAHVEDLEIRDVTRGNGSVGIEVFSGRLEGERIVVRGTMTLGLSSGGANPIMNLSDVDIGDVMGVGIYLGGIGDMLTVERMTIGPTIGPSIEGTNETWSEVHHLHCYGARPNPNSQLYGALGFKDLASVVLDTFISEDHEIAGIDVAQSESSNVLKQISNGVVRGNATGLIWRSRDENIVKLMEHVVFVDNDVFRTKVE